MRIRRLGWAGIEIEQDGETLLVDYITDTAPLPLRDDRQQFPEASRPGAAAAAVLTHLHADHADPEALAKALAAGAPVFRPGFATGTGPDLELTAYAEQAFSTVDLDARIVDAWSTHAAGPFTLHAVPAVDGFGDVQVSWVVEAGGKRILHGGDSLFHSYWWRIANRFGPFDRAFLPINGATVDFPFLQPPRDQVAVMTPEEAVKAARMLRAATVTPIHYEALHRPPGYLETPDAVTRLERAGAAADIGVDVRQPGDWFDVA